MSNIDRGSLIVFEGCDRSGKSTQCRMLVEKLQELGFAAQLLNFPDRTTATGRIINNYLTQKEELSDQAVHLLFSANRWEAEPMMRKLINEGVTLVVDRYSFSGVAYSASKTNNMNFEWCKAPEEGLIKPDLVFLLQLNEGTAQKRSGFGKERYEKSEFQKNVLDNFNKLSDNTWQYIDADKEVHEIHEKITKLTVDVISKTEHAQLKTLWED